MILISVGSGPGALRIPDLCRRLSEAGREVHVCIEPGAGHFIGPAAFAGLARVLRRPKGEPDALVYAPANTTALAELAAGLGERHETASKVRERGAVVVAPDLDPATAGHPAVRANISLLKQYGFRVLEADGMVVGEIAAAVLSALGGPLSGKRILITAGGTREPIDSVRFVGNHSSGKMGLAVAREALALGARVAVVAANIEAAEPGIEWVAVENYAELRAATLEEVRRADALIMAAAVSDFTPVSPEKGKIRRKENGGLTLELRETGDVLRAVREANPNLFMVGFSATHGDPVPDAREKLDSKGLDLVVGNDVSEPGIGFGAEENEVYILGRDGEQFVPRASKRDVAREILAILLDGITRKGCG